MRTLAQKQNQPPKPASSSLARSNTATPGPAHREHPILSLQPAIGNQAVQRMVQTHAKEGEAGQAATASPRFGHDFRQIPIHPPAAGPIQTKITINQPGDEYEQEADNVAEQVMRMPEPQLQRKCACGGVCSEYPQAEQSEEEGVRLQAKRLGTGDVGRTTVPPIVHEVLRTPGQPLDLATRAFMEPRFGHDFSQVRVHTNAKAADSAQVVEALAYTVGRDMVFGAGKYAPQSVEGRRLLAHELTHVTQQRSGEDNGGNVVMRQAKVEAKFAGCTGKQPSQIESVAQDAKRAINAAAAVVGSAYGRPDKLSPTHKQLLLDHFHTTSHEDLRTILGTYISIARAFQAGLEFQCETTCEKDAAKGTCVGGYAVASQLLGGFGPIHVCFDPSPAGCDFATGAKGYNMALLIHEAAHRHAGVDDEAYQWEPKYKTLSAKKALDNADSYAWFAVLV